ncbi:glycosyltransferase [Rubrobacter aplysinae]|uniref:glycosyltransferase n=1 Tax=Rubrobacter aplysinae TaxID=909625 RepID=UPI00064B9DA5|nr:glycosyltransferase [Rubrobacter aplysinae]
MEPPPEREPVVLLAGIRWDFLWQRHQEIAARLAARGHPVVFVETTGLSNPRPGPGLARKVLSRMSRIARSGAGTANLGASGRLSIYPPLVLPPTAGAFRWLNRRVLVPRVGRDLLRMAGDHPAIIAYPPTRTTLDLVRELSPGRLLYDCSDDYENFPGVPPDIAETERELLRRADAVGCTSGFLLEKVRPVRPDAFLCGPGVDFGRFNALAGEAGPARQIRTVCFFGHVGERLDLGVLQRVARAGFTVRLVGEIERSARWLLSEPGVDYRGSVPHSELPRALSGVDAFVLPYRLTGQGRGISPAKTYECLATGRPVVASSLPALAGLGDHVYLANGPEEVVQRLLGLPGSETRERISARVDLARRNDWERRVDGIERALRVAR